MTAMEFPIPFISWVKQCVTTAMFSIVLNGDLVGYFPGKRGLRQGDPPSPYLFFIILETFTTMLSFRTQHLDFTFHPKCQELNISHLIFADDIFEQILSRLLHGFHRVSGLQPNLHKSSIVYAGVDHQGKEELHSVLAIPAGFLPVK